MSKHISYFETINEYKDGLSAMTTPYIIFIKEEAEKSNKGVIFADTLRVINLINEGYLTSGSTIVQPLGNCPHKYNLIDDFDEVFWGEYDLNGKKITTASDLYVFSASSASTLTIEQRSQIIDKLNLSTIKRPLNLVNLQYYNLPNKNVVITIDDNNTSDSYHNYCHDLMLGSTFNSVKIINKYGNISSMNNLFRKANFNELTLVPAGGEFKPTDAAGMCEWASNLKYFPNTVNWGSCRNIGYTWEYCWGLKEILPYINVTTEEERITLPENIIGGNKNGISFANQAFNGCASLEKIGPVLDLKWVYPNSSNNYLPYGMFNNCFNLSNIRLKNLSNGNWDFSVHDASGLYSMDIDSIKYVIENLTYQPEVTWRNEVITSSIGETPHSIESNKYLLFKHPTNHLQWVNSSNFNINIPIGFSMDIYGFNDEGKFTGEIVTIVGNGVEQNISFSNTASTYQYFCLKKTNGDNISPSDVFSEVITIAYYDSNSASFVDIFIPSNTHTITFSGRYADLISNKTIITPEMITTANNKGWKIFVDNIELAPESQISANYKFSFNDWELNDSLDNEIEISDTEVIIKKFRPNVWLLRSITSGNSTELSTAFSNTRLNIQGLDNYSNSIFSTTYRANGVVGGDGGTKGTISGFAILPHSLNGTTVFWKSPELPFSSYVWDGATKPDGSSVQVGSETSAWRGDYGCGYNGYGFIYDKGIKLVYPNITTFPTPYNPYKLGIGLYTGNIHTFDRWTADNNTLNSYVNIISPFKVTLNGRRAFDSTLTSRMWATQEVFNNVKFKISGMLDDDYIKWSTTTSSIINENGETITQIDKDGIYTISNTNLDGGFIMYGNNSLTGTNPVTFEIIDNPDYIDSEGYIDISENPIRIKLFYDNVQ